MSSKIIACYLCSPYASMNAIKNFVKFYKRYKSGIKHKLIICFKNFEKKKIKFIQDQYFSNIKYIPFIDPETKNDFDFGSYLRVARKYPKSRFFFMNSYSYPIANKWLYKINHKFKKKTIIAPSGSYQSLSYNARFRNEGDNYFVFVYKIIRFLIHFKNFPNPHLRTSAFYITARDFINFMKGKKISSKFDAWKLESGRFGLSEYFKKKNYKLFIANSKGEIFSESNWRDSNTYAINNQKFSIIWDKHTQKFSKLTKKQKRKFQLTVWGK